MNGDLTPLESLTLTVFERRDGLNSYCISPRRRLPRLSPEGYNTGIVATEGWEGHKACPPPSLSTRPRAKDDPS